MRTRREPPKNETLEEKPKRKNSRRCRDCGEPIGDHNMTFFGRVCPVVQLEWEGKPWPVWVPARAINPGGYLHVTVSQRYGPVKVVARLDA